VLVSDLAKNLLLVRLLKGPAFRQESLVEDIGVLSLEADSLNDLADASAAEVTEHDHFASCRVFVLLERGWVKETCPD